MVDKQAYLDQQILVNQLIASAKTEYYKEKLDTSDTKSVFQTINSLLNAKNDRNLPTGFPLQTVCNNFAKFFSDKVIKIRKDLDDELQVDQSVAFDYDSKNNMCSFTNFSQVTEIDIRRLITKSTSKSCKLDCIPTWLLKEHLDTFLPAITQIINSSLSSGEFPKPFGSALITPILKKPSLDCNVLSNYRPVSSINFISKLIEKTATNQLRQYFDDNNLLDEYQSAYCKNKSTETALLSVRSDILDAVDRQKIVFLVMLDLSAAFDTIDHTILLRRMNQSFGISKTALQWISSYLKCRTSHIYGIYSDSHILDFGVPQGSVKGPLDFIVYTTPVGNIIRGHGLKYHIYADDTQVYVSFNPKVLGAHEAALSQLESCIHELKDWMRKNKLKLNPGKTEFFIAGTVQNLIKIPPVTLKVDGSIIKPSDTVRNLGIVFDKHMSMTQHINSLISTVNFHLRNLRRIGRYLDKETKHSAVRALILSRIDYGNALLYGAKSKDLDRLQSLQNKAAKLIYSAGKRDSPSQLMHNLHWLPIRDRIKFKICMYVYKCLQGNAPKYLSDFLSHRVRASDGPVTRSTGDTTLLSAHVSRLCIGDKSFFVAAPSLWNSLPRSIREACSLQSFKKILKSYLYPQY
jgi:hypothetical protein